MYAHHKENRHAGVQTWSRAKSQQPSKQLSERWRKNSLTDSFSRNEQGKISSYRYRSTDATFSISYDTEGGVASICSSDGRVWSRLISDTFCGWLVRTYFERWQVSDRDCGEVFVTEQGLHANGPKAEMLGLPERPPAQ